MDACVGYAALDSSGQLSPFSFVRRATGQDDVAFKVTHCGICHTDLHQIRNEWKRSVYPMVPGHEIVGIVIEVGSKVSTFRMGDRVGVGCRVRSCGKCKACQKKAEQFCAKGVFTYNAVDIDETITYGGYSSHMVANVKFVVRMPDGLPSDAAAPLLVAGITAYSPMRHFGMVENGKHLGVVGLGGVGHMAVKFGKAFGLKVTVISSSPGKEKEAKELLGADEFLVSSDKGAMQRASNTLDYILDTVSAPHELGPYLDLLDLDGKMVFVGVPDKPFAFNATSLIYGRKLVAGSLVGSIQETQEMLDFCAEKGITPTFEKITPDYLNQAMDRLSKSDVKYRFVIDFSNGL
ncbi:hypothetical protein GOP47_0013746 [Adiantum capillus-veneris]|uniref:Enoyl reductase (ER) domain-containing protein n=1 Tax=Adiantum capillus-veneris TaxID=13818 RepID=A0A9D4UPC7_ADICA|nr:hypothetical protein GOP47_0013746 [Adiantum capillus-veneris]